MIQVITPIGINLQPLPVLLQLLINSLPQHERQIQYSFMASAILEWLKVSP